MWTGYLKRRRDKRRNFPWTFARYGWTVRCEIHEDYKIATVFNVPGKTGARNYGNDFRLLPAVNSPLNDCDQCWGLYYRWFLTKHTLEEFLAESDKCERWREAKFFVTNKRRAWRASRGIGTREKRLLEAFGFSQQFIEEYSSRTVEKEFRGDDWVSRAITEPKIQSGVV